MINHARTLLLNTPTLPGPATARPGQEIVPASFGGLRLPPYLVAARAILFGSDPDAYMLDYRVHQLLRLVEGAGLQDYLTAQDGRISYRVVPAGSPWAGVFHTSVMQLAGAKAPLYVQGLNLADDALGRMYRTWRITVVAPGQLVVVTPKLADVTMTFNAADGLSDLLPLPGSSLQFRQAGVPGDSWQVTAMARPGRELADVLADATSLFGSGSAAGVALFGNDFVEPYRTFRNLFNDHSWLPQRLAGFVLAVVWRSDALLRA